MPRSHLTSATSPALASGPEADGLQAGVPCSFVTGWTSSSLPRWGYSPRCCRSRSPAPFLYGQVVQCPTHVQQVRRQKLCRSRDSCVEQPDIESTRWKNSVFGASDACWKHTGLLLTTAQCEQLFIALYKYTYLLTYTAVATKKLEAVQWQAAKIVTNWYRISSCVTDMLSSLEGQPLEEWRTIAWLAMFYKIHNNLVTTLIPLQLCGHTSPTRTKNTGLSHSLLHHRLPSAVFLPMNCKGVE